MPALSDMLYRIYGAWRLFRLDVGGMGYFDDRIESFWQSFFAAVICAPGYLVLVLSRLAEREPTASGFTILAIETIAYVIGWTAFPLSMFYLTQALGRAERFIVYFVAYNWARVIQILLQLPVSLADLAGLAPGPAIEFLMLLVFLVCLGYDWFIARTALAVSGLVAAAVVGLDLAVSLLIILVVIGGSY